MNAIGSKPQVPRIPGWDWSVFQKRLKRIWLETPLQLRRLCLHFCVDFP